MELNKKAFDLPGKKINYFREISHLSCFMIKRMPIFKSLFSI
jgi:hypothetical protein